MSFTHVAGFVLVKKVPGTLHFTARDEHHSFDHDWMNLTHVVHAFHFGSVPSAHKYRMLQRLHPLGLSSDWLDKLKEQRFYSLNTQHTHEHYLQVCGADDLTAAAASISAWGICQ